MPELPPCPSCSQPASSLDVHFGRTGPGPGTMRSPRSWVEPCNCTLNAAQVTEMREALRPEETHDDRV